MTTNTKTNTPAEGQRVHFLQAVTVRLGTTMASGAEIFQRGAELTITADILEASRDRNGASWIERELAKGDESATLRKGAWPEGRPTWRHGDRDWYDAREQARQEAWKLPTEDEQNRALREVEKQFGPGTPLNKSINVIKEGR